MPPTGLTFERATPDDAPALVALVRSAYRGEESRRGWTTEAELLGDERIDEAQVRAKIADPAGLVLVARDGSSALVACCEVLDRGRGLAYFGLFAVRPELQAAGIGRQVLAEAERRAVESWGAGRMEMTVIAQRAELIAWYERRGYRSTPERRPFPYDQLVNGPAHRDDLYFTVLVKPLGHPAP